MRHTEYTQGKATPVTVTLTGGVYAKPRKFCLPSYLGRKVERYVAALGAPDDVSVPAEQVFPELKDDRLRPSMSLRGARYKENMTQKELAKKLGIKQHHLSEMENGKRAISKSMARQLADVLRCDYRLFL